MTHARRVLQTEKSPHGRTLCASHAHRVRVPEHTTANSDTQRKNSNLLLTRTAPHAARRSSRCGAAAALITRIAHPSVECIYSRVYSRGCYMSKTTMTPPPPPPTGRGAAAETASGPLFPACDTTSATSAVAWLYTPILNIHSRRRICVRALCTVATTESVLGVEQ